VSAISRTIVFSALLALPAAPAFAAQEVKGAAGISLVVKDETSLPVEAVQIVLYSAQGGAAQRADTDAAGKASFAGLKSGQWELRAQKKGFYPLRQEISLAEEVIELELVMTHEQELSENVDVIYSAPRLDPSATEASGELSAQELIKLPYPSTRDLRNALPLLSGVVRDSAGNLHVQGSASSQTLAELDGFNISNPGGELLDTRVSSDAVRNLQVESSRYSAEFGKYSGGVVRLETGMGDDHFRFSATDFVPSLQSTRGLHINTWTPRATLSGPISKGGAWFYQALDGEYGLDVVKELPEGQDRSQIWRVSSLTKAQVNLPGSHALTATLLLNRRETDHAGLSPFNPLETTVRESRRTNLVGLRDQWYLSRLGVVDIAAAVSSNRSGDSPMGSLPYEIQGESTQGNFFRSESSTGRRWQTSVSVTLPRKEWRGSHEVKFGLQADRVTFQGDSERRPIRILDSQGQTLRDVRFTGGAPFRFATWESGGFAQDRWSPRGWLLLEMGMRMDSDSLTGTTALSPRLAANVTPAELTKVSLGLGVFRDSSDLGILATPFAGVREETDFTAGVPSASRSIRFMAAPDRLSLPRSTHWSVGVEQQAKGVVFGVSFLRKRGVRGWTYAPTGIANDGVIVYDLSDARIDTVSSAELSVTTGLGKKGRLSASYARSSARSSAVFAYDADNVIHSALTAGPQPWDAPNRALASGWHPLLGGFEVNYALDWRSGFPFSVVNQRQELIGEPNDRRYPTYFSLNLHIERRIRFANYLWELRAGANNLTDHRNPAAVNNNIDSPGFLTFSAIEDRAFVARIRFLGRK